MSDTDIEKGKRPAVLVALPPDSGDYGRLCLADSSVKNEAPVSVDAIVSGGDMSTWETADFEKAEAWLRACDKLVVYLDWGYVGSRARLTRWARALGKRVVQRKINPPWENEDP